METFRESFVILVSIPVYAIVIGIEMYFSHAYKHKRYTGIGTFENLYMTAANMGLDILMRGVNLFLLSYFFTYAFFSFQNQVVYWVVLIFVEDLMFYLLHLVDHYCRFFWAVHVTHHNSEEFNLTVGFRSSVLQPMYRTFYFIPLSLMGFHPMDIYFVYSIAQIYGILIHTQYIGKLGLMEHIFATPSNHRVHHGSNVRYLDRNMGMVFIIWDKLFRTYTKETENVKYGLTENIHSHNPGTVIFHEWKNIWNDVRKAPDFKSKFMYIFGPPGWSHDGSKKTSKQLRDGLKE